jgi:hypothetical protein
MLGTLSTVLPLVLVVGSNTLLNPFEFKPQETVLASEKISLEKRVPGDPYGNQVFKDNILLTIGFMRGIVSKDAPINWEEVRRPFEYQLVIAPGETYAFHDQVLDQYKNQGIKTSQAHFNYQDGFKSAYGLYGNGVCHLASLMYWVSLDAGVQALAPTNHDFAVIPEIDRKYGVAIYSDFGSSNGGGRQNLYITNNKENPIGFKYNYDGEKLRVTLVELH